MNYAKHKRCYTITGNTEVHNNVFLITGLYYNVYSVKLPNETGYDIIPTWGIDNFYGGRFYSSPEKAAEAYKNFQKLNQLSFN